MYLVDVVDDAVDDLPLERLEHNSPIAGDKLGLSTPTENHPFADIEDRDHSDDVPKLAGTCTLDVGV